MKYQLIPYAWVLFASALISLIILYFAWRRRSVPGARPFLVLMVSSVLWSLSNALEMMGTDLPMKLFWANFQYICYNVIPVTWLVLTLQYTGRDRWLTRRRMFFLLIIPVLTIVIAWTNQYHGLLQSGASGYLLKDLDGDEFIEMLLGLEKGEVPLSPGIAARFLAEFKRSQQKTATDSALNRRINEELTPRQIEILTMAAGGMTYKEIGSTLSLSEAAIKYHMGEIIEKLQLQNRNQAIALARKAGLQPGS